MISQSYVINVSPVHWTASNTQVLREVFFVQTERVWGMFFLHVYTYTKIHSGIWKKTAREPVDMKQLDNTEIAFSHPHKKPSQNFK